jgi:putative ABC transport system permease protein
MFREIFRQAWDAVRRNPTRSALTMLGIVWGIVSVTLLIAYGSGFRTVLLASFDAFGKSAVICWPGQTSQQAGGERAGKPIRFEQADVDVVKAEASLVKHICLESVRRFGIQYGERLVNAPIRAVCPEYGEVRNEVPTDGRWLTHEDMSERRRVIFIGGKVKRKLFSGRPAIGETVRINGVRFTVVGTMDTKIQMSSYFSPDDDSAWIPYASAADIWDTRFASVIVFSSVSPQFEPQAMMQVRTAIGKRQGFSPTDLRAIQMFGRQQFRPIVEGITVGLQVLLLFIGILTLGIGGVGVMNIMLVSVNERIREIGLRMAIGARRSHIRWQFLTEALVLTVGAGVVGIGLAYLLAMAIGTLPLLGPLFEDESGRGDLKMKVDGFTVLISTAVLLLTGVLSGLIPAMRAAALDPSESLRYE